MWFLAGILAAVLAAGCSGAPEGIMPPARPNVLLVTIDTFRADRLGVGIAPALDRLAANAVRFTSARTAVPLTLPSHTTILTGLLPPEHGVRENGVDALSDTHSTVARLLKDAGYQTAAFVGAYVLDRRFGLAEGFDTYDDQIRRDPNATERLEAERPAAQVVDRALAWLDQEPRLKDQGPFFVWIHLYDPHAPYTPPPEFIRTKAGQAIANTEQRYDGEVRYVDAQISRVFDWLRAHSAIDRTLIIVAGDHGEGLGEHHERTHGMLLYDSTLRVPLFIAAPHVATATREDPVSLADIAPTLVHAAGVTVPVTMKGRNLLEVLQDRGSSVRLPNVGSSVRLQPDLYSETEYPRVAGWSPLRALTDGRWMAIRSSTATEVYDLRNDPGEQRDVASAQPSIASAMTARIDAIRGRAGASASRSLSPEAAERLRTLGYVASSAPPGGGADSPNPAALMPAWNQFEDALSALADRHTAAAVQRLAALAANHPNAPVFQTTYARALQESGQLTEALGVYRAAVRRSPNDAALLHDLAVTARDAAARTSGEAARTLLDEAARADAAAVVVEPKSAMAHNGLGLLAIDRQRPQDAVKEFDQATALDPNNASYWTNLGNARRALRDAPGAEQAYRRALDVDARSADAANGLGVLLVELNRPGDAVPWLERAIAAAPDFAEARLNLGIALQQNGAPARAIEVYRSVLALRGGTREKQAAAKLLASLGAAR